MRARIHTAAHRMRNLKLDYTVVYMGQDAGKDILKDRFEADQPTLFSLWTPHPLLKAFKANCIALPPYEGLRLQTEGKTDYSVDVLEKIASSTLAHIAPPIKSLYEQFVISHDVQASIMLSVDSEGKSVLQSACDWMKANEETWRKWIPLMDSTIKLAVLHPMTGWKGGPRIAGAAALAVEMVNADKTLLPGRVLQYSFADSGCSAQRALTAMGELLGESRINAVIGPGT